MLKKIGMVSMNPKAGVLRHYKEVASPIGVMMNAVLVPQRHSEINGING